MYYSRYNIIADFEQHSEWSIIHNLLHGGARIITRDLADRIRKSSVTALSQHEIQRLRECLLVYECQEREADIVRTLEEKHDRRNHGINPIGFYEILVSYSCNLRCAYCFQKEVRGPETIDRRTLEGILQAVAWSEEMRRMQQRDTKAGISKPIIAITGGEPLQRTPDCVDAVSRIIDFCHENGFQYSITTNGVALGEYIEMLCDRGYPPTDLQVTIDGPEDIHNDRRTRINGGGSFSAIIDNIQKVVDRNVQLRMRVNVDESNVNSLGELLLLIKRRQWHTKSNYSAYLAPITDHNHVLPGFIGTMRSASLLRSILKMMEQEPGMEDILELYGLRTYSYVRRSVKNHGEPRPAFWRCQALQGQLVFDPSGAMYTCVEAAGNAIAKIGECVPRLWIDEEKQTMWKEMNAFSNRFCRECEFKFVCGGGCPWQQIVSNRRTCPQLGEEIGLSWNHVAPAIMAGAVKRI